MEREIIPAKSEYESLLEEIRELKARIADLIARKDDLLYHICPALRARYEEEIGSIEREILAAELYLREKRRILEILRSQLNRQKKPSYQEARKTAEEEFRKYEEDLRRKAEEEEKFREKWETENGWYRHDQEEAAAGSGAANHGGPEGENTASSGEQDADGAADGGSRKDRSSKAGSDAEDNGAGTGGQADDSADDGADDSAEDGNGTSGRESIGKKLKKLYYKIVKMLHPDVNPDATEHEKELFNRAQEALKSGDYEAMKRIYEELTAGRKAEEAYPDTPEGILALKELRRKLQKLQGALLMELSRIRSEFPYTMKALLEDEDALAEKQQELRAKLQNIRDANDKLDEIIGKVRRKMKEEGYE